MNLRRLALAFVVPLALPVLAQLQEPRALLATGVDLLLIEHTPNGVIERSGRVRHWRYAADSSVHAVLCVDHTPDGDLVMLDGFDAEVPSCP